jgi:hypothetical protein
MGNSRRFGQARLNLSNPAQVLTQPERKLQQNFRQSDNMTLTLGLLP